MLTEDQLKELETKHQRIGRIADVDSRWEVVLRKPRRDEYKRFRAMLHNDAQKADATEWLARACVVHPSPEAFDSLLEDYPALGDAAGDEIAKLVGFTVDKMGKR